MDADDASANSESRIRSSALSVIEAHSEADKHEKDDAKGNQGECVLTNSITAADGRGKKDADDEKQHTHVHSLTQTATLHQQRAPAIEYTATTIRIIDPELQEAIPQPLSSRLNRAVRLEVPTVPGAVAVHTSAGSEQDPTLTTYVDTGIQPENVALIDEAVVVITGNELFANDDQDTEAQRAPVPTVRDQPTEVLDGKVVQEEPPRCPKPIRFVLLSLIMTAVLAVVLGVLLGGNNSNSKSPAAGQDGKNTAIIYPPFQDNLPISAIKVIEDVGSIYYLSNKWMVQDPNLDSYNEVRQRQRFILTCLYYIMNGDAWFRNDNWMTYNVSECQWFSQTFEEEMKHIPTCDENDNLLSLGLSSNNLQGIFPILTFFRSKIFLPKLIAVDLSHNNISGTTPILENSENLQISILSNNSFDSFGAGTKGKTQTAMRILKADSNRIRANFQGFVFPGMQRLEVYNMTGNYIEGIIAPSMGTYCRNLTYVGMGHNLFAGSLPSELGLLTALKELDVSGNGKLAGILPTELGALPQLTHLYLTETLVTGQVPDSLCNANASNIGVDTANSTAVFANCSLIECCGSP